MTTNTIGSKTYAAVVAAIVANKGIVIDDHKPNDGVIKLAGVGKLQGKTREVPVALCEARYFSLNEMYVDEEGRPHVGRNSVAGTVIPMDYGMDLKEAIAGYNKEQAEYPFSSGQVVDVQMFEWK